MKFRINLFARRFKASESSDSGYYGPTRHYNGLPVGRIDINLADSALEQILTIFHEVAHMVFDLYTKYEVDPKSRTIRKRNNKLKDSWRAYNKKIEKTRKDQKSREEQICCKIEGAISHILKRYIPKKYQREMFTKPKK